MIEIKNLTTSHINDLSLSLEVGVLGLLSDNSDAVASLLNNIVGISRADKGEVLIDELDAVSAKKKIGYLPAGAPLYCEMTAYEYLSFIGSTKKVNAEKLYRQIDEVFELLGLGRYKKVLVSRLDDSTRTKLGLAGALLGNPSVIVLDGLFAKLSDPNTKYVIKMLGQIKAVILSSADVREIADVCDNILVLSENEHKLLSPDEITTMLVTDASEAAEEAAQESQTEEVDE